MLPRKLKNFNLFIDGVGFAGRVPEMTLPKLSRKMEELRAGGMNAPLDIDMGMEKMTADFTLAEFSRDVLTQFGIADNAGVNLRFRGAALADDDSSAVDAIEITLRGRWVEIDRGTAKPGDNTDMKVNVTLAYYKETVNDEELFEIDILNMKEVVGGEDRLAAQRDALGI